jgi:hypothetical protein
MIWQDYVIGAMTILFSIALIPQVYYGFKVKKGTILMSVGLLTSIGLYVLAIAFATLELYFSMVMNVLTGTLWLILLLQTIVYREVRKA